MAITQRRVLPVLLALSLLAGCGGRMSGVYVNLSDPKDRIEFTSSSTARVSALAGQGIDVWMPSAARDPITRQLQAAQAANQKIENVDVEYRFLGDDTIQFSSEGRGSRMVRVENDDLTLTSGDRRRYVKNL